MLEDVLATLLARVLGTFVSGIDGKSLNLSVWRGEVRLSGLQLRRSALEALNLPARVIRGDVGEVVVRVPWRSLGRDPLVVALHNTTLLLAPADTTAVDARAEAEQDMPAKQEALAARLKCEIIKISEEAAKARKIRVSPMVAQCVTELTMDYAEHFAKDILAFSKHRKGKTIALEDVTIDDIQIRPSVTP